MSMSVPTHLMCRLITLLLPLTSLASWAENNRYETLTITATRDEQSLRELASSLSVVSEQELKQVSAVHISESLSRVPGVWVSRGNGQEHLTAIRSPVLTGAGSCSAFYIAEDGIPVRPSGFCNVNQLFDINTEQARQIEVLKGPGTVLHGSNALHGVINVLSQAPSEAAEQKLSLEGGPHDYGRIRHSTSNTYGAHGYRVSINGAHDGGYKHDSGFDQQKLSARYDYGNESVELRTLLSLSNLNQETAGYVEGTDAYKDDDRRRENGDPVAFRDSQSARLQTRIEKQLDGDRSLIVTPFIRYSQMDFLMHFLPGTPKEENGQTSVGIQTAFNQQFSPKLSVTNGFDAEYTNAYLKQTQDGGFSSFPSGRQYDFDVTAAVYALFITGNYLLSPDTTLSAGTRYESLDYDYDNRMMSGDTAEDGSICINSRSGAEGCRYSRPEDRRDNFNSWSFTGGLVHHLNNQFSVVSRLAHGFRAPQATELYRLQAGQLEADLDSVEIDSVELGLRANQDRLSYSLTTFYMKKNNVIFQTSDRRNLDDGQTQHYGLEYQFAWQFATAWDLNVAGTFARHEYSKDVSLFGSNAAVNIDGNDIDTAPRHMGTLRLGWQATPGTRTELEWVHMGKYYTDIDNEHSYEGHDLVNLSLRQQVSSNVNVGLRVTNLADEAYAERADFSGFSGDRYFIGEPRSVFADISLSF
jgi:iron complex outermembrane recepter protein